MDDQVWTESAQPLDPDALVTHGARTMRQFVFGHQAHRALTSCSPSTSIGSSTGASSSGCCGTKTQLPKDPPTDSPTWAKLQEYQQEQRRRAGKSTP